MSFCVHKWNISNFCRSFSTMREAYDFIEQETRGFSTMDWWIIDSSGSKVIASGRGSPFEYRR